MKFLVPLIIALLTGIVFIRWRGSPKNEDTHTDTSDKKENDDE